MIQRIFFALSLCLLLAGCDAHGVYHYGVRTDIVNGAGAGALYLRSSETGTDMVIFGAGAPGTKLPLLVGTVDRDSSTTLQLGTYTLGGSGSGTFDVTAAYDFPYEPSLGVAARQGSQRSDFPSPIPVALQVTKLPTGQIEVTLGGVTNTYTPYADVVAAIDLATPEGTTDLFQVYNLGLFFSQVRIPAFGSIGMTRYITAPGHFNGLISGVYDVSVKSFVDPTATIAYTALEDFPGEIVSGSIITAVDLTGSGPMHGVITFEIHGGTELAPIVYEGSVDYGGIHLSNGLANSGNYAMTVTAPTAATASLPYTLSTNVDLRHVLPVGP